MFKLFLIISLIIVSNSEMDYKRFPHLKTIGNTLTTTKATRSTIPSSSTTVSTTTSTLTTIILTTTIPENSNDEKDNNLDVHLQHDVRSTDPVLAIVNNDNDVIDDLTLLQLIISDCLKCVEFWVTIIAIIALFSFSCGFFISNRISKCMFKRNVTVDRKVNTGMTETALKLAQSTIDSKEAAMKLAQSTIDSKLLLFLIF